MIEKYTNGAMVEVGYDRYENSTDTITTLPTELIADSVSAYTIKGNMAQNGTPTPQNPIQPIECGKRTENLFDGTFTVGYYINATTGLPATTNDPRMTTLVPIDVTEYDSVTFNFSNDTNYILNIMYSTLNNGTLKKREATLNAPLTIDTTGATQLYLCVYPPDRTKPIAPDSISSVMLNEGSTTLPYEPYGFKIPIITGNTTTPAYLGEVQSTRQIKSKIITANNQISATAITGGTRFGITGVLGNNSVSNYGLCNYAIYSTNWNEINAFNISLTGGHVYMARDDISTVDEFKAWLTGCENSGNPVTIWYVLATPETGIANEPLRKIGDYADSIAGLTIPTSGTAEQFDVDTPIKPSEVSLTYTGWHNKNDHKF